MSEETCTWNGVASQYTYWVTSLDANFKEESGNYIFAKRSGNHWTPVYIGQTDNLRRRLSNHDKEACVRQHGATHIHAHLNDNEQNRRDEEVDLIKKWQPPCNEQLFRTRL